MLGSALALALGRPRPERPPPGTPAPTGTPPRGAQDAPGRTAPDSTPRDPGAAGTPGDGRPGAHDAGSGAVGSLDRRAGGGAAPTLAVQMAPRAGRAFVGECAACRVRLVSVLAHCRYCGAPLVDVTP